MKLFYLLFIFSLFSLSAGQVWAARAQDEDFGYWSSTDVEHKINEQWKVRAGEDLRFRERSGLFYFDTHAGAAYQASPFLLLGGDYLQVRQTRTLRNKDVWDWEYRPRLYATLQSRMKGFLFENRNMLEFRFKENAENTTRYRNLSALTAPWKWTRFEMQPFISNEIFFETSRSGLIEDRFHSGFKLRLTKNIIGSLYYFRQFSKSSSASWRNSNILGSSLKISF